MAKQFSSLKQGLGLLDFFIFGKYKGCRVDSILEEDPAYIIYIAKEFNTQFTKDIIKSAETKLWIRTHETTSEKSYRDSFDQINGFIDDWEDDIPF